MFGAAASPIGWNWNLISRDRDRLLATVGVPVGLDDGVLNGGPIGVGRSVLAGRSVLGGVVPPFGVLATDGTRFAVQRDWFGMASIYVYRSYGVVVSNRPMLLPYVFGDPIHPDAESFARYAACDAFLGSSSPVMGRRPRFAATCRQSARRRHLVAVLYEPRESRGGLVASRLIELARGAGRSDIVHHLISPRNGSSPETTTGVERRLTDLFRHYDFSYRRQFVLRGRRIQDERIPAATINGALGGIAWGAWVPQNWSQASRNPAEELDGALRHGLISKAGGPICEPAAGWINAYLGELIEHAALLGLNQVQSLTWM